MTSTKMYFLLHLTVAVDKTCTCEILYKDQKQGSKINTKHFLYGENSKHVNGASFKDVI